MKSLLFLIAAFTTLTSCAQMEKKRQSPHDTVSNSVMTITYGRPYKKDRDVFGGLEPFGKVWRLGADEATTITFKQDVKFGGSGIKAGTYTLAALLNEKDWTLILNSQLGQWGAFKYDQYTDKDVAKITVPVTKTDKVVEQLTISFEGKNVIVIQWDNTVVKVPVSI